MFVKQDAKPSLVLFFLGFLGILSITPLIPKLILLQPEVQAFSLKSIQVIYVAQSSLLLLIVIWLGTTFSSKVKLSSPVIFALFQPQSAFEKLQPQIIPALISGALSGAFLLIFSSVLSPYLSSEFLIAIKLLSPAWYGKLLYGGITEELIIRWGFMSFVVWGSYRLTQQKGSNIKSHNYIVGIILSAIVFGLLHLPIAFTLFPEMTVLIIVYIVVANTIFGLIAGFLYWKRGLECAIGAHIIAHITMILGT